MTTKRTTMKMTAGLGSYQDVDRELHQQVLDGIALSELQQKYEKQAAALKQDYERQAAPIKERMAGREGKVEAFALARKTEFELVRTRSLTWGKIGFRQTCSVSLKRGIDYVAELKERGLFHCVKVVETPIKDQMGKLPDDVLTEMGAKKKVEDVFFIEVTTDAADLTA